MNSEIVFEYLYEKSQNQLDHLKPIIADLDLYLPLYIFRFWLEKFEIMQPPKATNKQGKHFEKFAHMFMIFIEYVWTEIFSCGNNNILTMSYT